MIQYSRIVQEEIKRNDIFNRLITLLKEMQETTNLNANSIATFFSLLNKEEVEIKNDEISDLMKLAKLFQIDSLKKLIHNYLESHMNDIDLILSLKISEERNENQELFQEITFLKEIENIMKNNINECLDNDKIKEISVSTIYRILEGCQEKVSTEKLYHFIIESIEERHIFFDSFNLKN